MNYLDNPLSNLHAALAHAVYEGFPDIEYEDRDWEHYYKTKEHRGIMKTRKHTERDVTVMAMFPQTWSSTALGFGGIGGQAITAAYTIVLESHECGGYCVYFGSRFAYRIERANNEFIQDMANGRMVAVTDARARYERTNTRIV